MAYYDQQSCNIRHTNCYQIFTTTDDRYSTTQCDVCHKYQRNVLNSAVLTVSKADGVSPGRSSGESHTNYRYCNTPEKYARLTSLHSTVRLQRRALQHLESRLAKLIQISGVKLEDSVQEDLLQIMNNHADSITAKYGEDSLQAIFWDQQVKAATAKGSTGRRWHPLVVKWCLYLHHISGKAYETIRKSGILTLPSSRTLQDYKHLSSTTVGFSIEADRQLLDILNQKDDLSKYGVLLFDEMYIKQGLVFEKSTGSLFGFTDLGNVSNQLDEFLQSFKDHSESLPRPLAKAMLVFMVKGLFNNVSLPYAQFPVCSVKGGDIFPLLWKAIGRLERIGYTVLGITGDGCSPNRRLFKLHRKEGTPTNEAVYKTTNIFCNHQKDVFFFVDPPHLLKTIRNCFANPLRHLWVRTACTAYIVWAYMYAFLNG